MYRMCKYMCGKNKVVDRFWIRIGIYILNYVK